MAVFLLSFRRVSVIQSASEQLARRLRGRSFPGLFSKDELLTGTAMGTRRTLWRRAWQALKPTAVLCVDGWPTIYFRRVVRYSDEFENKWQQRLWNLGHATAMVVFDDDLTRIYSGLAAPRGSRPGSDDYRRVGHPVPTSQFSSELIEWLYGVQTGEFYGRDQHRPSFAEEGRLDRYLLRNLSAARNRLCRDHPKPLSIEHAHALLGRCLFASYLLERGVLDSRYLRRAGVPPVTRLRDLLSDGTASENSRLLFALFRRLQEDFNGSLFGDDLNSSQAEVRPGHLEIVRDFLSGYDFETGQISLADVDFYDFSLIPIELISAIYEDFVSAADGVGTAPARTAQRRVGAYYTPPRLAELVVDIATRDLSDRLDTLRCLDPACGSGIFLVLLFRRMAECWRARNPNARRDAQADALRRLLTDRLFGIDQSEHACRIACFSLYLAFLDQFEKPRDILTLQRAYKKRDAGALLPPLLRQAGDPNSRGTIYAANFFDADANDLRGFDIVVGNPPWTGRYQDRDAAAWKWISNNPAAKMLAADSAVRTFYPQKQAVIPFLWKTPTHLARHGRGCLLIAAKTLMGNDTSVFQSAWFRSVTVEEVWQLSDYRRFLFGTAQHPGVVVRFGNDRPRDESELRYFTPKVDRVDPREATITVGPDDQKLLTLRELLDAAEKGEASSVWKRHFWGTPRDQRVLHRLLQLPRLSAIAGDPHANKPWVCGQGFQRNFPSTRTPEKEHWKSSDRFVASDDPRCDVVLLHRDTEAIGERFKRPHRARDPRVFEAPKLIVNQGFSRVAYCTFRVFFEHRLQSIVGSVEDADLLKFLTVALRSPLGDFLMFHLSANWGVERKEVHLQELLLFPFPRPEETTDPRKAMRIVSEVSAIIDDATRSLESGTPQVLARDPREIAMERCLPLVYAYYDLKPWEQQLIEDTARIFARSSTPATRESQIETLTRPDDAALINYGRWICRIVQSSASRGRWKVVPTIHRHVASGLALLTLERVNLHAPTLSNLADHVHTPRIFEASSATRRILGQVARAARRSGGSVGWVRGFTLVEERRLHILKPLTLRYWTATAAMNDGDQIAFFLREAARAS